MPRGMKASNEYARAIRHYQQIPKSVLAAVAYSFAIREIGEDNSPAVFEAAILDEWKTLHENGIVPQSPGPSVLYPAE